MNPPVGTGPARDPGDEVPEPEHAWRPDQSLGSGTETAADDEAAAEAADDPIPEDYEPL